MACSGKADDRMLSRLHAAARDEVRALDGDMQTGNVRMHGLMGRHGIQPAIDVEPGRMRCRWSPGCSRRSRWW